MLEAIYLLKRLVKTYVKKKKDRIDLEKAYDREMRSNLVGPEKERTQKRIQKQ